MVVTRVVLDSSRSELHSHNSSRPHKLDRGLRRHDLYGYDSSCLHLYGHDSSHPHGRASNLPHAHDLVVPMVATYVIFMAESQVRPMTKYWSHSLIFQGRTFNELFELIILEAGR